MVNEYKVLVDNNTWFPSPLQLSAMANPVHHRRMKHTNIDIHFIHKKWCWDRFTCFTYRLLISSRTS
uniref:Uncharacterized protein n=1 Tax=Oryza brachyantha TaxID=4533 RepID=J3LQH2_ORYBR